MHLMVIISLILLEKGGRKMNENMHIFRCVKCKNLIIFYDWYPVEGLYCACALSGTMDRKDWVKVEV